MLRTTLRTFSVEGYNADRVRSATLESNVTKIVVNKTAASRIDPVIAYLRLVLVAHNAHFDVRFLNHEIGRMFEDYRVGNPHLCTVNLSRKLLPDLENHRLHTVAEYYSIFIKNRHRAADDALATANIFCNFLVEMNDVGITDLSEAQKLRGERRKFNRFAVKNSS